MTTILNNQPRPNRKNGRLVTFAAAGLDETGLGFRFAEDDLPRAAGDRHRAIGAIFREYREAVRLTLEQWQAVELYYCQAMTIAEAAARLHISRHAVRRRITRAFFRMFDFAMRTRRFR